MSWLVELADVLDAQGIRVVRWELAPDDLITVGVAPAAYQRALGLLGGQIRGMAKWRGLKVRVIASRRVHPSWQGPDAA